MLDKVAIRKGIYLSNSDFLLYLSNPGPCHHNTARPLFADVDGICKYTE